MVIAIFTFIWSWNEFLYSSVIATRALVRPVPVAIALLIGVHDLNWGVMAAAATVSTIPILILSLFLLRHIVRGLTMGAVK
jgi:multiple sugar transport system permease protein